MSLLSPFINIIYPPVLPVLHTSMFLEAAFDNSLKDEMLHTLEYLSVISWIYILVHLGAVGRIRTYAPKGKLISFSCIVAVHHVPAAVNGCPAACVHYLKNMMTIKSNQNSKFFFWSGHWSRDYSQLTDRGKTCKHTTLQTTERRQIRVCHLIELKPTCFAKFFLHDRKGISRSVPMVSSFTFCNFIRNCSNVSQIVHIELNWIEFRKDTYHCMWTPGRVRRYCFVIYLQNALLTR